MHIRVLISTLISSGLQGDRKLEGLNQKHNVDNSFILFF